MTVRVTTPRYLSNRSRMRACGFDVLEMMHGGWPTACIRDVPFAYVNVAKTHVTLGFFLFNPFAATTWPQSLP